MRVSVFSVPLFIVLLVGAQPALAQTASTPADQGEDNEARALFEAGQVAFSEGRFENALEYFERAYELSQRPALLYNIGSSADRLRQDARALEAFEAYLVAMPDADNRQHVEARMAVLREAVADGGESPVEGGGPSTADDPGGGSDPAPLIIVGVSAGVLVAGVALLALSAVDIATVEGVADGGSWDEIRDAHDRAPIVGPIGWALAGLGFAGVVVGLGWGIAAGSGSEEVEARIGPNGIELRGRF